MTKRKIVAAVAFCCLVSFLTAMWFGRKNVDESYIFDNLDGITIEDVKMTKGIGKKGQNSGSMRAKSQSESLTDVTAAGLWSDGFVVDSNTLRYFRFLDSLFKDSKDFDDHMKKLRQYLADQLSPEEMAAVLEIYEKYLACELALMEKQATTRKPTNAREVVEYLREIQEYRRSFLGQELADALFGPDVKSREYAVRRADFVSNRELYGAEKEQFISQLNQDMWGDEADVVEEIPNAYNRYREKMVMYQRDLDEMDSEEDQNALIREFRETYFSSEQVQELEQIDIAMAQEQAREDKYYESENAIVENSELTQEQKDEQIQKLQQDTFGDDVESFRRRDNITKELDRRKNG